MVAKPEEKASGAPGYRVVHAIGSASWMPAEEFERSYRRVTRHERRLLTMTDAEHRICAISDGDREVIYDAER